MGCSSRKRRETHGGEDCVRSEAAWRDAGVEEQGLPAIPEAGRGQEAPFPRAFGENLALLIS